MCAAGGSRKLCERAVSQTAFAVRVIDTSIYIAMQTRGSKRYRVDNKGVRKVINTTAFRSQLRAQALGNVASNMSPVVLALRSDCVLGRRSVWLE